MDPALRRNRILILQKNVNSPNQTRENMKLRQPVRVSISFGVQPQQLPPAEETVDQHDTTPEMEEPLTIAHAQRLEQPRRILTPPQYLTAQLPDSSEESDKYVEVTTAPRRSIGIQEQHTNRLSERLLEVTGQQLQRTRSAQRTNRGQSVKARNFVDFLNKRRQQRQERQFVPRLGSTQQGTSKKRSRTDMNELKLAQRTSRLAVVEDNLFGTSSSMGHCVSSDFFIGAGLAERLAQLYPKMKTEASSGQTLGSIFAFYDQYSRIWIYHLITKPKFFHKFFIMR